MNDEELAYVALAAMGGLMGLAVSLSQPVTGFFITGITMTFAILGLTVNLKRRISDRLPSFTGRTMAENQTSIMVGFLTLISFIPFLFPEILIAAAMFMLLAAALISYMLLEEEGSVGFVVEDVARLFLAGLLFIAASQARFLLIIIPALMYAWFMWTILPKSTREKLGGGR